MTLTLHDRFDDVLGARRGSGESDARRRERQGLLGPGEQVLFYAWFPGIDKRDGLERIAVRDIIAFAQQFCDGDLDALARALSGLLSAGGEPVTRDVDIAGVTVELEVGDRVELAVALGKLILASA